MPFDATSAVGETNPQSSTDQMDKILNAVIANSLKLTQVEATLHSLSVIVKQLVSRIEETVTKVE